jgi:hypothetical protein
MRSDGERRMGEWANGRMGEWANGRMGEWACARRWALFTDGTYETHGTNVMVLRTPA